MTGLTSKCRTTGIEFTISEREQEYCRKNGVPLPRFSPFERLRQLAQFRNRSALYHTKCSLTGKKILTQYPPSTKQPIYHVAEWMGDGWDPLRYGRPYDFSRPFFPQIAALFSQVPVPHLSVVTQGLENSEYTNGITCAKNCYLLFGASYNEDCYFSRMVNHSQNVMDLSLANYCELCYECFNIYHCYHLLFSENCHYCSDSAFLFGCQSCKNCYGCSNLTNAEYYFYNERLSKEEYTRRRAEIALDSYAVVQQEKARFKEFLQGVPRKYYSGKNNESSTGNYLNNTKNCTNSFFCSDCEDIENSTWLLTSKDCLSTCCYGDGSELIYNSVTIGGQSYNVRFSADCWPTAQNVEYCIYVGQGSSDCFGCVGLKHAHYCILNVQYSKDEYFSLVSRIIAHMKQTGEYGHFFPSSMTPYPYNVSEAQDWFPLTKQQADSRNIWWEEDTTTSQVATPFPDSITNLEDAPLLENSYTCEYSGKPFRFIKKELQFYRALGLPLPHISPMMRLQLRRSLISLQPLKMVECSSCGQFVETMYSSESYSILCEACYQKFVIT